MTSSKPSPLTSPAFPRAPPNTRFTASPDADQQGAKLEATLVVTAIPGLSDWPTADEPSAARTAQIKTVGDFARSESVFMARMVTRVFRLVHFSAREELRQAT